MKFSEIVLAIIGVGLSVLIAWIIDYETRRWKKGRVDSFFKEADDLVDIDIITCWKNITNPKNMAYYTVGYYSEFEDMPDEIEPGTVFKRKGFTSQYETNTYVVLWEPPKIFAWGQSKNDWHDRVELKKTGDRTRIFLERKLSPFIPPWNEFLFVIISQRFSKNSQNDDERRQWITDDRLERIISVCENPPN
ncbi:hypothetical protein [Zobellia roscoffensis]|uniref:hypothetical protein n=1 Tax=Zobellia roscoffensis TaxID=2779508 RepID=UPI00188CEA3F|nr:hypothetical protein [Zobellia roscoffensis]